MIGIGFGEIFLILIIAVAVLGVPIYTYFKKLDPERRISKLEKEIEELKTQIDILNNKEKDI